ncbi:hypothetical protein GCM10008024_38770 [Allgaiera indica]|uniref:Ethylbenzene dehydrogenase n=2 Tax=root TaxID=1 RepID=A0AAN4UXM7_9RHOB|nr:ethylbenzene dehydrogenase-related protein [Allgaiera indica]GHE05986.1 hypothetical protein GCM10008024_38770 [Allgaiera indica]SDX88416.1 Ethylbenzene dehydrogenase [Allgaiera indica]
MRRTTYLAASAAIFAGLLVAAWATHGTGVVRDDPERNIAIPKELTSELQVKVAYDGEDIWFRYRWPVERPAIFNDVLVYNDGKWETRGGEALGSNPEFLTEDRVAMMIDDGSVPLFSRYGGYITIGEGLTTFTGTPETDEERTKYLPSTRTDPDTFDTIRPAGDLEKLRAAGQFIDLWQWRSSRSNPIGLGDDGFVAEERGGDEGTGPYMTNFDKEAGQPKYMFNPDVAGYRALKIDEVISGKVGFNDTYYLAAETAVPFDPTYQWQNGDTIPRRFLRPETGSRADVVQPSAARWRNGFWDVTLRRKMDTGNPLDDKIFRDGGSYDVAFAVFRNASTMRWHYISLPASLGLGEPAQINAKFSEPGKPDWTGPWTDVEVFYPGQVSWPRLTDPKQHPGADRIAQRVPVAYRHTERQLALYGVEVEFSKEIKRQWLWTLGMSVGLIVAFGFSMMMLFRRREEA